MTKKELIEERDLLAYENKAMAEYIKKQGGDVEQIIFDYKENVEK